MGERPTIPGYNITQIHSQHRDRVLYCAYREQDNQPLIVEALNTEYPSRRQIAELRREAALYQQLKDVHGVINLCACQAHGSSNLALIYDSFFTPLSTYLPQTDKPILPTKDILDISLQLTETIGEIHRNGLVHKAISSKSVLIGANGRKVFLSGFGIASELGQEPQTADISWRHPEEFAYMSPEQTGRMNRDLDYRSDYYSLGILLFELLTGEKPFSATGILEWVHCHIGRSPPSPRTIDPSIPEVLSNVVLKLLAKNPEDRYQSATGLYHDLNQCYLALAKEQKDQLFKLGEKDTAHTFLVPQNLYGREAELQQLLSHYKKAISGQTHFCLVQGYSGVGKTALVNELNKYQTQEQGFAVQAKFDQYNQGDTYSTLAKALRGLVQQVLLEPEEKLANWRKEIQTALQGNGILVVDLIPELSIIIGEQAPVPELPPTEAKNRLHMVLTGFIEVFASARHPVTLFLDDLQWCDVPTLHLIQHIVTNKDQYHLLLIGAYRSNEVSSAHPLQLMLDAIVEQQNVSQLSLRPLDQGSVVKMVADSLKQPPAKAQELGYLLFKKAQGNPFFTNELLKHLHESGAITPSKDKESWQCDLNVADWSNVSDDVVEFMISNLRKLGEDTQALLQLAACIGGQFDLKTLAKIHAKPISETARTLLPAIKQYTIRPLHKDYRLIDDDTNELDFNAVYRFQHDRVQQAAYSLIHVNRRKMVHLSIGRLMLKQYAEQIPVDYLMEIVAHLNIGRELLHCDSEKTELAKHNLSAAQRARKTSAYETALGYTDIAKQLIGDKPWQNHPDFMQQLAKETQLCSYLTGRVAAADLWMKVMLQHADSKLEKSKILATRTRQYATLGRMQESMQSAIEGLSLLGIELPTQPSSADIACERALVIKNLNGRKIQDLVYQSPEQDAETLVAMSLFMEVFAAAFLSGSGKIFPFLVLKSVNLSLRSGLCPESAFAYAAYGMILCGEFDEPALAYQYGKLALAINEKLGDLTLKARVTYVYAMFIHHWSEHWSSLTSWFKKGIEAGYQSGDLLYLAYSAQDCIIWDPQLDLETAHRIHAENLKIVRECAYQDSLDSGTLFLQLQRNLLGLTHSATSLSDDNFDEKACLLGMQQRQFKTGLANYHIYSAEVCFIHGAFDKARNHLQHQEQLIRSAMSLPQLVRYYLIANLTLAEHYPGMSEEQQAETLKQLKADLQRMRLWANNCEANFQHIYCLMSAEIEKLSGKQQHALNLYDSAIETAQKYGFLRDEAMASERAARLLLTNGKRRSAEGYLRAAYQIFARWGAVRKLELLQQEFPVLNEITTRHQQQWRTHSDIDLASVLKASRAISSEIHLEKLLDKSLKILLENAGAQWGYLLSKHQSELRVEAAIMPDFTPSEQATPNHSKVTLSDGRQLPIPLALITRVLHSGKAIALHQASTQGDFTQDPYILNFQPKSVLCVPIKRERFEGVIYLENNLAVGVFSEDRVETIRLLAAQASVALENARLYEQVQEYSKTLEQKVSERTAQLEQLNLELQSMAHFDGLTGVANRRRCDEYLTQIWATMQREQQPLTVVMLDVDHFKNFNDLYGHQAGDDCLIQVARAIQGELHRPADIVARYGGEEFILILPNTEQKGARLIAEKARKAVASLQIQHANSTVENKVTISVGTATCIPIPTSKPESLIKRADRALYQAKQNGRNQVLMSEQSE